MTTRTSFRKLITEIQFDRFFNEIYIEWEKAWLRKNEYIGTNFYTIEGNIDVWRDFYLTTEITLFIYLSDEKEVGYIGYQIIDDSLIITEILIKETERGNKLGSKLMDDFLSYINKQKSNLKNIVIETHSSNISNKIYLKAGFILKEIIENDRENGECTNIYVKPFKF